MAIAILMNEILKNNESLSYLNLGLNNIGDAGAMALYVAMQAVPIHSKDKVELNLSNNSIGKKAKDIMGLLPKNPNMKIIL